jgi:tetratricopeptide (TPR) repeat protein
LNDKGGAEAPPFLIRATEEFLHMNPQANRDRFSNDLLKAALLLGVTLVIYIPAMKSGFIWDDDSYLLNNRNLLSLGGLWNIWFSTQSPQYYPLVFTTFWIEQHLWGLAPAGYHAVNVLLHFSNSLLLWAILRKLNIRYGFLAGLLFAVHPVQVESVAWVTERKNVLSAFFYFLSALSFLKYEEKGGPRHYLVSLALFIPALLSKTVTCSLPVALLIIRWMRGGKIDFRYLLSLVPFFAAGLAMGLVTVWWELNIVGAKGNEWDLTHLERLLLPGRVALFYIQKLIYPSELVFIYPKWAVSAADLVQWAYPAALLAILAALFFFKEKLGRGPLAAALFFLATLFPALGFFNIYPFQYSYVADHFQYLASAGIFALAAGAVSKLVPAGTLKKPVEAAGAAVLILVLGGLTLAQGKAYKDLETLWTDTITKNPGAFMAHTNLGVLRYKEGNYKEAMAHFNDTLKLKPDAAAAHYNIALILYNQGSTNDAAESFRRALESEPEHILALVNYGKLLSDMGQNQEAVIRLKKAVELAPANEMAHNNIAIAYARSGDLDSAVKHLNNALKIKPDYDNARKNLSAILSARSRTNQ